ncbi:MAG: hypothetical protein ABFQ53_02185 [Patescibacteria group bacterium]
MFEEIAKKPFTFLCNCMIRATRNCVLCALFWIIIVVAIINQVFVERSAENLCNKIKIAQSQAK